MRSVEHPQLKHISMIRGHFPSSFPIRYDPLATSIYPVVSDVLIVRCPSLINPYPVVLAIWSFVHAPVHAKIIVEIAGVWE